MKTKQTRSAADVCRLIKLKPEALSLLRPGMAAREFFDLLIDKQEYSAAIRFLPQVLSKRSAVWWGCLCLWQMTRPEPNSEVEAALSAALSWVQDPCEQNRLAAEAPGRAATLKTAHGCLALATFWTGGSMTKPNLPVVAPPAHLTGKLVSTSLFLSAVIKEPFKFRRHYQKFLMVGIDVARGINRWTEDDAVNAPPEPATSARTAVEEAVFASID